MSDLESGIDQVRDRLSGIYDRWNLARRRSPRGRWWEKQSRLAEAGMTVAFFATFFLIFVDLSLTSAPAAEPAAPRGPSWRLASLLLLFLCNGELLTRIFRSRAPFALPVGRRIGMALACGVPFLGLYAFAAAARWRPGSGDDLREPLSLKASHGSPLDRFHSLSGPWTRVLIREWSLVFYLVTNMLVVFWILSALPGGSWVTRGVAVVLHAAAASGLVLYTRAAARPSRAVQVTPAMLLLPAGLTLFPLPFVPFLGYALYAFAVPRLAERSLIRTFLESRRSTARLPRWLELQDALRRAEPRRWLPVPRVPEPVRELVDTARYLLWVYAIKSSVLVFDGAAASWLAFWAAARFTLPRTAVQTLIAVIAGASLALGGIGLLLMLVWTFQNRLRIEGRLSFLDRHPAHRYLAAGQLAFATGLFLGGPVFAGDGREVGNVIALAALGATAVSFPRLFLSAPGEDDRTGSRAGWTVLFVLLAMSGFAWASGHESTEVMLWLFRVGLVFFPLAVPLLVLRQLLTRLLRPFGLRDLLDPEWSTSLRRSLRFLTVTALLPLGGLAVPAWIWIRYRYWPDFEREWLTRAYRLRRKS